MAEASKPKAENLKFVEVVKKEEPKPKPEPPKPEPPKPQRPVPKAAPRTPAPAPPPRIEAPAPPKGFQTLQAPVNVPVKIPDIDLAARATDEADFSGKGIAGGTSKGREGGTPGGTGTGTGPALDLSQPFRESEVEVTVSPLGNVTPDYPSSLREGGVEGQVVVEFVVTEGGRVDMGSVKIVESSHALFTSAVRSALPRMRFSPAKIGGRAVKQYVRQPFTFRLTRS